MGEEFPEYTIERRRGRPIRPIGRGIQRKRTPATHLSPVLFLISRCSGDDAGNALRGEPPAIRNMPSPGETAAEAGGGISMQIPRGVRFAGNAGPVDFPGNFQRNATQWNSMRNPPVSRMRIHGIARGISWARSQVPGESPVKSHGEYPPANSPCNCPNCPAAGISRGISRETASAAKKLAPRGGPLWSSSAILSNCSGYRHIRHLL